MAQLIEQDFAVSRRIKQTYRNNDNIPSIIIEPFEPLHGISVTSSVLIQGIEPNDNVSEGMGQRT